MRVQALQQERCSLARHHLLDVGLMGTVALPDLFGAPFLGGLTIFRCDGGGIDQLLGERRDSQSKRNERHSNERFQNCLLKKIALDSSLLPNPTAPNEPFLNHRSKSQPRQT